VLLLSHELNISSGSGESPNRRWLVY